MSTTVRPARAWIPATLTTFLVVVLLFGCGLVLETLRDRDWAPLRDTETALFAFVYGPMAPVGSPGIVGNAPFGDSMVQVGGGLVPVVILVFLFTWLAARGARAGSAFTVLIGAWLGTILGVGLGAVTTYQIFLEQNDITDDQLPVHQLRLDHLSSGFYWGAVVGLPLGLVALLTWLIVRPRAEETDTDEPPLPRHLGPEPDREPTGPPTFPPPSGDPGDTVRAPQPPPTF
jgi:hypothetical protein